MECPADLLPDFALRSSYEKLLVRLAVGFVGGHVGGDVLHEFAAAFRTLALDHAHAAGRHVAGFERDDAAIAHLYLRAKPIGAEHSPRTVEGHRGCDRTFEFFSGAGQDAL